MFAGCWLLVGDGLVGASGGLSLRTLRLFQRSVTVGWIRMESLRPSKGSGEGETFLSGVYGVTSPLNPTCISSMGIDADDRWIECFSLISHLMVHCFWRVYILQFAFWLRHFDGSFGIVSRNQICS